LKRLEFPDLTLAFIFSAALVVCSVGVDYPHHQNDEEAEGDNSKLYSSLKCCVLGVDVASSHEGVSLVGDEKRREDDECEAVNGKES